MGRGKNRARLPFLRTVLLVCVSLVLGLSIYSWNAHSLVGNHLPMPFGVGVSVVLSGSMEPALSVDDLVVIRAAEDYAVGDVVVYQSENMLVIHRIIRLEDGCAVTQGDANNYPDDPVSLGDIKGRLWLSVPGVGRFVRLLKSPAGVITFLLAAVLLLELSWRKEKKQDEEDLEHIKEEIQALRDENSSSEATETEERQE